MAHPFGSTAWADDLRDQINGSSEYRNAAAAWGVGFNGNMLFRFEADDKRPTSESLLIRLEAGHCAGAEFVPDATHPEAGFVLAAPFGLWQDILERRAMAATSILTGKMKVVGDKMTLLKHTAAHRALVHCTSSVDTAW